MSKKHVFIGDIDCGSDQLFLIAGPCVIEEESLMMRTAERLKKHLRERLEIRSDLQVVVLEGQPQLARVLPRSRARTRPSHAREDQATVRSADPHGHPLSVSGGAGRRGLRRHPDSRVPVHAVGARRRGRQDRRRRQHQARPVLGAREHGEAGQEDRGLRQRPHHRDGARLHVRLQRSRRRSAQLLPAEPDRLPRRVRRGALDPQVRHTRARTRAAARGSS